MRPFLYAAMSTGQRGRRIGVPNLPPTVSAGSNQNVTLGSPVNLAATASDPDGAISSYAWSQLSGTAVTLSGGTTANPSFTAPGAPTTIVLRCTVTDNQGATAFSDVTITVGTSYTFTTEVFDAPLSDADGAGPSTVTGYRVWYSKTDGFDWLTAPYQDFSAPRASADVTVTDAGPWFYYYASKNAAGAAIPIRQFGPKTAT